MTTHDSTNMPKLSGAQHLRKLRRDPHATTSSTTQTWTNIDRDYETIRLSMQTLLNDLDIATKATAASTTICRSRPTTL